MVGRATGGLDIALLVYAHGVEPPVFKSLHSNPQHSAFSPASLRFLCTLPRLRYTQRGVLLFSHVHMCIASNCLRCIPSTIDTAYSMLIVRLMQLKINMSLLDQVLCELKYA